VRDDEVDDGRNDDDDDDDDDEEDEDEDEGAVPLGGVSVDEEVEGLVPAVALTLSMRSLFCIP
jgi:hypothetical protein